MGVGRVANGCGDENIRFVVVVVKSVGVFIVVDRTRGSIPGLEVVEMTGIDVDFVVIFGM